MMISFVALHKLAVKNMLYIISLVHDAVQNPNSMLTLQRVTLKLIGVEVIIIAHRLFY